MNNIICIAGPTASGKTALAVELAKEFHGEVISCDSMQIYRRMDIGTAKPTKEEMQGIPHHMLDVAEPEEDFSVSRYCELATPILEDILARGKTAIIAGGTGLYVDNLIKGGKFAPYPATGCRERLEHMVELRGIEPLIEELRRIDPESAEKTHPNNVKRVARAIEIYRTSGITKSELDRRSRTGGDRFDSVVVGLRYEDRDALYSRIDRRVDEMISQGLCEETAALEREGVFLKNGTAAQAIGYKEILPYIRGEGSLEDCVEVLKMSTRRYAKRQCTWFSGRDYVKWLDVMADGKIKTFEEIVNNAWKLFFN